MSADDDGDRAVVEYEEATLEAVLDYAELKRRAFKIFCRFS